MNSTPKVVSDQHCLFSACGAIYAVSAMAIREVIEAMPVVSVPSCPPLLSGVCHLRTAFVPVVSLTSLLGVANEPESVSQLLILDGPEGPWAIEIQHAIGLHTLEMAARGEGITDTDAARIMLGTATFGNDVVQVIDANRLYQLASESLNSHWSRVSAKSLAMSPITV